MRAVASANAVQPEALTSVHAVDRAGRLCGVVRLVTLVQADQEALREDLRLRQALDRLAASFADGVFKRGDSLLLWRGGTGHVENFFLQDCSMEIVHAVAQGDLRERQSEADPIRRQMVYVVEVNTAHR